MTKTYRCQNCDWTTNDESQLREIKDFAERHLPGDLVGDGECPECGALCFEEKPGVLETTKQLFLESLAAWQDEEDSVIAEHKALIDTMRAHAESLGWLWLNAGPFKTPVRLVFHTKDSCGPIYVLLGADSELISVLHDATPAEAGAIARLINLGATK